MKRRVLRHEQPRLKLGTIGAVGHGTTSLTSAIQKSLSKHKAEDSRDVYDALVGSDPNSARRAKVVAESLVDAKKILEDEYGAGTVLSLWNRAAAGKPRRR